MTELASGEEIEVGCASAQLTRLPPSWVSGALTDVQEVSTVWLTGWRHADEDNESVTRMDENAVEDEKMGRCFVAT